MTSREHEKIYSAQAFHPGLSGRVAAGKLSVERLQVCFEADATKPPPSPQNRLKIELPLANLIVRPGGHNGDKIFFEHPDQPGCSICVSDREILEHDAFKQDRHLQTRLRALKRQRQVRRAVAIFAAAVLVGILGLIVWLAASKARFVRAIAAKIPVAWEQQLGETLFEQVKGEGRIVDPPELSAELAAVTRRLVPVIPDSGYTFDFHILADTNVNAFALPGGHVLVNTGLLRAVKRPEELAGVLAHELAHVTQRHGFRMMIDAAGLYLAARALLGDLSGLHAMIANSSQALLRQKFSRDFEREADEIGWQYLVQARIDPRGMIDFFKRLQVEQAKTASRDGSLDFMSSHPSTAERIERLQANWARLERKSGFVEFERTSR